MRTAEGPPPPAPARRPQARAWRGLLVVALALAAYAGTLRHELVWDDTALRALVGERTRGGGLAALVRSEFRLEDGVATGYYRPLVLLSLAADARLSPGSPAGYHLQNVLLHALASLLVFALLGAASGSATGALVGGALFALHPVHVESVAFVSGRTDVLCAVFLLPATLLWLRVRRGDAARPRLEAAASVALFLLACLAKETAFVLPAVLLAWDLCDGAPGGRGLVPWLRRNGAWVLAWGAVLAGVLLLRHFLGIPLGRGAGIGPDASRILARLAGYAALLLVPWPLNSWHTAAQVRVAAAPGALAAAALAALFLLASGRSRGRAGLKALAWTLGFLLPALGGVGILGAEIAERFLYIPSVGLALLAAGAFAGPPVPAARVRARVGAAAALAALFAAGTLSRARTWKDEESLYRAMTRSSPGSALGYNGLGRLAVLRGDPAGGIALFRQALRLEPDAYYAHTNLGDALIRLGRHAEAAASLARAVALKPDHAAAHNNLGVAAAALGRPAEAERHYRRALELAPGNAEAWYNLANCQAGQGRLEAAVASYRKSLALDPRSGSAHFNLALRLAQLGRARESAAAYREALALDPGAADVMNNLAWLLATESGFGPAGPREAVELATRASASSGGRDPAHLHTLATALAAAGRSGEAAAVAERAIGLAEARGDRELREDLVKRRSAWLAQPAR